jgi:hypothetical protein
MVDTIDIVQQAALSICESLALIVGGKKCGMCDLVGREGGRDGSFKPGTK